jgi:hypothetical protein
MQPGESTLIARGSTGGGDDKKELKVSAPEKKVFFDFFVPFFCGYSYLALLFGSAQMFTPARILDA